MFQPCDYIKVNGQPIQSMTFSGGESQIRLPDIADGDIEVFANIKSASSLIELLLTCNAIEQLPGDRYVKRLYLPYLPYARQDRACAKGEAFSLELMADLLSVCRVAKIESCDVHSKVAVATVSDLYSVSAAKIISKELCKGNKGLEEVLLNQATCLIAPDKGAQDRVMEVHYNLNTPVRFAEKVRNPSTGKIIMTKIYGEVPESCFIIDDICDGGRTFIELAKVLREKGAKKVYLYVTHGIFSQGFDVFKGLIDKIFYMQADYTDKIHYNIITREIN